MKIKGILVIVTLCVCGSTVQAGPLNQIYRWLGLGWSDGYHSRFPAMTVPQGPTHYVPAPASPERVEPLPSPAVVPGSTSGRHVTPAVRASATMPPRPPAMLPPSATAPAAIQQDGRVYDGRFERWYPSGR